MISNEVFDSILAKYHFEDWQGVVASAADLQIGEISDQQVLYAIAHSYCLLGFPELGIPAFARCLELVPHDYDLRLHVVRVLLDLKEWLLATELLNAVDWPSDYLDRVLIDQARCQAHIGNPSAAELQLIRLQGVNGVDLFELGVALAEVNLRIGNIERVEVCLRRLNDLSPGTEEHALLQLDLLSVQWVHYDVKPIIQRWLGDFHANPRVVDRCGQVFKRFCRFDDAYSTYKHAFQVFPFQGKPAENFLRLLVDMSRLDELRSSIALDPLITPPVDLGLLEAECLLNCDKDADAADLLRELPESLVSLHLLGNLSKRKGDYEAALRCRQKIYAAEPLSPDCQFEYAEALLSLKRWREAWSLYESRFHRKDRAHISPAGIHPLNSSLSPSGRNVLVFGEQGLGDTVMMASMLPDLLNDAATCSVFVQPRLQQWFAQSFPSANVFSRIEAHSYEEMDSCYGIGSLGQFYRSSSDQFPGSPYLQITDQDVLDAWHLKLHSLGAGLKIGVAWRGGRGVAAKRRSLDLVDFLPFVDVAQDAVWVNLQYPHSDSQEELQNVKAEHGWTIHQFEGIAQDMYQTAALTQSLDLVITVQQTALHVAGAVGVKAFVLLPVGPEWRYGFSGYSMPWYNSVELFRQDRPGDWDKPIAEVKERLAAFSEAGNGHNGLD